MSSKPIEVTAAVIIQDDKILIGHRRNVGWEFPGGKIEVGETPANCLIREIREELSIEIEVIESLLDYIHHYNDKSIRLISFWVKIVAGTPVALEHDQIQWISIEAIDRYDFLAADLPIVNFLKERFISRSN